MDIFPEHRKYLVFPCDFCTPHIRYFEIPALPLVSPVPFFILPISYSLWNKFQIAVHSETHIFAVHHCNQMPSLMVLCLVRIFPVPIFKLIAISLIGSQITNFNGSAAILTFAVFFLLQVILIPEFKIWYKLCSELDDLCVNLQVSGYVHVARWREYCEPDYDTKL